MKSNGSSVRCEDPEQLVRETVSKGPISANELVTTLVRRGMKKQRAKAYISKAHSHHLIRRFRKGKSVFYYVPGGAAGALSKFQELGPLVRIIRLDPGRRKARGGKKKPMAEATRVNVKSIQTPLGVGLRGQKMKPFLEVDPNEFPLFAEAQEILWAKAPGIIEEVQRKVLKAAKEMLEESKQL